MGSNSASDLWDRVIDSLQHDHPQYLAELLRTNGLEQVIRDRVQSYLWRLERAQKLLPRDDHSVHDEMACEALGDVNPNREDEEPLTPEEQELLRAFQEKHQIEA